MPAIWTAVRCASVPETPPVMSAPPNSTDIRSSSEHCTNPNDPASMDEGTR
jgi:hypothetical protein